MQHQENYFESVKILLRFAPWLYNNFENNKVDGC